MKVLRQSLSQSTELTQKLTSTQQYALRILTANLQVLTQEVSSIIDSNPLIEKIEVDTPNDAPNNSGNFDEWTFENPTLQEHLSTSLAFLKLDPVIHYLVQVLIDHLDDRGFLIDSLEDIVQEVSAPEFTLEQWQQALATLQTLEPAGVGAASVLECLKIQLRHQLRQNTVDHEVCQLGLLLLNEHLSALQSEQALSKLSQTLQIDPTLLQAAVRYIQKLPKNPAIDFQTEKQDYIEPDVVITLDTRTQQLVFVTPNSPQVQLISGAVPPSSNTSAQYKTFYQQATQLIYALQYRRKTLDSIVQILLQRQQKFLTNLQQPLVHLTLKELATQLNLSPSTITRAIANKYVQCIHGVIPLKHLFNRKGVAHCTDTKSSEWLISPSSALSDQQCIELLRAAIEQEDPAHPLSDAALSQNLQRNGIIISRRTISKYRHLGNIPSSRQRKKNL